jgi:hypothetical protein
MTRREAFGPLAAAFALAAISGAMAQPAPTASPPRSEGRTLTGKERLAGKAADEQRVDDCKVPADRRGRSTRPAECGGH